MPAAARSPRARASRAQPIRIESERSPAKARWTGSPSPGLPLVEAPLAELPSTGVPLAAALLAEAPSAAAGEPASAIASRMCAGATGGPPPAEAAATRPSRISGASTAIVDHAPRARGKRATSALLHRLVLGLL